MSARKIERETGTEGYPEDVRRLVHAIQARSGAAPQQAQQPKANT